METKTKGHSEEVHKYFINRPRTKRYKLVY